MFTDVDESMDRYKQALMTSVAQQLLALLGFEGRSTPGSRCKELQQLLGARDDETKHHEPHQHDYHGHNLLPSRHWSNVT